MDSPRKKPRSKASGLAGSGEPLTGQALERVSADVLKKVPPQNHEAEQGVLGGILLKNSILYNLIDLIGEDDFYSPAHRLIFQAMLELSRKNAPIDLVSLAEELRGGSRLDEVGGPAYLAELSSSTVSAANALHHAVIVREKAIQRKLISTAVDIISRATRAGQDTEQLLDASEQAIFSIADSRTTKGIHSAKDLITKVFEQIEKRIENKELVTGVPTGYYQFDEYTAGLQPSDLIIIAGRPSMGKTAFAMNVAMRAAAMHGVPTAIFSLEMSMEQIMQRMLCCWGKVDLTHPAPGAPGRRGLVAPLRRGQPSDRLAYFRRRHRRHHHHGNAGPLPPPQGRTRPGPDRGRLPAAHARLAQYRFPGTGDFRHLPEPQGPGQGAARARGGPVPAQPQGRGTGRQAPP